MRTNGIRIFSVVCVLLGHMIPSAAWAGPVIETWETTKGTRVLFVSAPDLPMLDVRLVFDAGSARDGKRAGLASLTAGMLTQGGRGVGCGHRCRTDRVRRGPVLRHRRPRHGNPLPAHLDCTTGLG